MRLPRFRCAACGGIDAGIEWPSHCRSTPELDRLQAHLCALMTERTAADALKQTFPVDTGKHHGTLRRRTLKVGEASRDRVAIQPETAASAIVVTLDSTSIRSCAEGKRRLEIRARNVETAFGGPAGFRRHRQSRQRHRNAEPPHPRRCRENQGHGADRLHRWLPRAPARSRRPARNTTWPSSFQFHDPCPLAHDEPNSQRYSMWTCAKWNDE